MKLLLLLLPIFALAQTSFQNCNEEKAIYEEIIEGNYSLKSKKTKLLEYIDELSIDPKGSCTNNLIIQANFSLFDYCLKAGDLDGCLEIDQTLKKYDSEGALSESQIIHLTINESELNYYLGDFKNSMRKANQVLTKYGKDLSVNDVSRIYDLLGKDYLQLYKQDRSHQSFLDSSNYYFNQSYSILKKSNSFDFENEKARFYNNKLDYIMVTEQYNEALKTANRALIINNQLSKYNHTIQKYYLTKSSAYYHLGKYDSVIYNNRQIEPYIDDNDLDERLMLYDLYQKTYSQLGSEDTANMYLNLNVNILENLNKAKSNSLKKLYGIDIENLQKENDQQSFTNKSKTLSILSLLVMMGCVIGAFYWRNKKEKEKYETLFHEKYQELQFLQNLPKKQDAPKAEQKQPIIQSSQNGSPEVEEEEEETEDQNKTNETKNPLTEELIEELAEKIHKMEEKNLYLRKDFNLNYLSKKLGTNTAYLSYYFNHIKKQSFPNYLNHLRINYILQELNENPKLMQYSMEGLAKESGFKDASVFSKIFKKIVGIPPSYYVENLKKEREKAKM